MTNKEPLENCSIVEQPDESAPPKKSPLHSTAKYGLEDSPPWYLSLLYGLQQYLAMVGGTMILPIILFSYLCMQKTNPAKASLMSSIMFVSGIITILQSTIGVRLPIVQGGCAAYIAPTIVLLTTTFEDCSTHSLANMTMHGKDELWQTRMCEVQGAIILASLVQMVIGFTGLIGLVVRWITPLTIVPTITLVGLSLTEVVIREASQHWGITILSLGICVIFSQYLSELVIPFPSYVPGKRFSRVLCRPFKTLSLFLGIIVCWIVCGILTLTNVFPQESPARTDSTLELLYDTPWFRVPYPGQWGLPTITGSGVVGMLAAVFASIIESIGDYYTCARVVGAKMPPTHAINRGIAVEGIGGIIAGVIGTGSASTSYTGNIAILTITDVYSRRVIQYSGLIMVVGAVVAKLGAVCVIIPGPIIAGISIIKFAMITSVGLSTLHYIDLTSSRNLFTLGLALFIGISFPKWVQNNPNAIKTGVDMLDHTLTIVLQTPMALGGLLGFFLDNTIPGTAEERGLNRWVKDNINVNEPLASSASSTYSRCIYDIPFGARFRRIKWLRYLPFCPSYTGLRLKMYGDSKV